MSFEFFSVFNYFDCFAFMFKWFFAHSLHSPDCQPYYSILINDKYYFY